VRHRRLHHVEIAEDVGAEGPVDLLRGDLVDLLLRVLFGRVVDEHIELAEPLHNLIDRGAAEARIADVPGDGQARAPFPLDQALRFLRILALV
jgi:hypothetical protein